MLFIRFVKSSRLPNFCPQTFPDKTPPLSQKRSRIAAAVTAVTLSGGLDAFVKWCHLKAQRGGKSRLTADHFWELSHQGDAGGNLTATVYDLMTGFRSDGDSSFWKVTFTGYLWFCDGECWYTKRSDSGIGFSQSASLAILFSLVSSVGWLTARHDVLKGNAY